MELWHLLLLIGPLLVYVMHVYRLQTMKLMVISVIYSDVILR